MQNSRPQDSSSPATGADDIVLPDRRAINKQISEDMRRDREQARGSRRPGARQWINLAADAAERKPDNIFGQFNYCLRNGQLPAGTGVKRSVGDSTRSKFGTDCRLAFNQLREGNATIRNLRELKVKHALILIKRWCKEGKSPTTINGRVTALRKLTILLGRPLEIPTGAAWKRLLRANDIDPQALERSQICVKPRSVSSKGLDPQELVDRVRVKNPLEAQWLQLSWAFGLRPKECCELNPLESDKGNSLEVRHGAKAERRRPVFFSTKQERAAMQRSTLDDAKRLARKNHQFKMRDGGRDVKQALNHFYYVMRKNGITGAQLDVTPYSFRHEFAHQDFEEHAGLPAPVLRQVDPSEYFAHAEEVDEAEQYVSGQMGHSDKGKYRSYGGSRHEEARRLKRQSAVLDLVGANEVFSTAIERAGIPEVWVVGKAAAGNKLRPGDAIDLALRAPKTLNASSLTAIAAALVALPRQVNVSWCDARPPDGLEVIFARTRATHTNRAKGGDATA